MKFDKDIVVLQRFIEEIGSITRTQAVKLSYLADIDSSKHRGHQLTNFKYTKYYYGPYDETIVDLLNNPEYFSSSLGITSNGHIYYSYSIGNTKPNIALTDDEEKVIQGISKKYKNSNLDSILRDAYATKEFTSVSFGQPINLS